MADLKVALEDVEQESLPRTQVSASSWRRWVCPAVSAVLLLLTAGSFAWRGWRASQHIEPLRAVLLNDAARRGAPAVVFARW